MRSPVVAMLWENWRLTRVEAALRFAFGIVAASAALLLSRNGATAAFWILITLHGMCVWFSILKLNGGKFSDGYKPGFPFYLLYARPVPTVVFVGVAMVYDAVTCVALYVVSAAVLGFAFAQPLPLFSVAAWIVAFHFCYACVQWATANRAVQWIGSLAFLGPLFFLLRNRVATPLQVEFSLAENALMVLIGVVAFGFTVAGVTRQRRGGAVATLPRATVSGGYPNWLINLFRFPCPTSSAMRAQLWFELKSSGLPVLAIGLTLAILITSLFAISIPVTLVRVVALGVMVFAPVVLFTQGVNAFGIRRKQGRAYASTFEATQPHGTAELAGLKVLVRSSCLLIGLTMLAASAWLSSSLVNSWGPWVAPPDVALEGAPGLTILRRAIEDAIGGLSEYVPAALAVVTSIAVALMVASLASLAALRARYPRRVIFASSMLLFCGFALVVLAWAAQRGFASEYLVDTLLASTQWFAAAAIVLATVYLLWNGFAQRVLTFRYACGAFVISAVFGGAWVTLLHGTGVQLAGMPAMNAFWMLSPVFLPVMTSVLAPWSLSRIRHT